MSRWIIYGHNGEDSRVVNFVPYFSKERAFLDAAEMQYDFPSAVFTVVEVRR